MLFVLLSLFFTFTVPTQGCAWEEYYTVIDQ